jgi:hypothetical protein
MVQGYCKMRFDRTLDEHDLMLVMEFMADAEPPIATRDDPRFQFVFDILDHSPRQPEVRGQRKDLVEHALETTESA